MKIFNPKTGEAFIPFEYSKEEMFERKVVELSSQIFGEDSIYFDIKKKIRNGDIATIPDGYLLDLTNPVEPTLYVVENELSTHDAFNHIGIQLLKFVTSFDESQEQIKKILMAELQSNNHLMKKFEDACSKSNSRNIDFYMDSIVNKEFRAIVIIDETSEELQNVISKINALISVIELRTYINSKNEMIHEFNTLYDDEDVNEYEAKSNADINELKRKAERRQHCDTVVVPARKEGFEKVFLGEDRWYAIKIGAAMRDKIKWIAAYQKAPISAITHVAKVKEIKPYKNTGKFQVIFEGAAEEIKPIKLSNPNNSPQGPVYAKKNVLDVAKSVDDVIKK